MPIIYNTEDPEHGLVITGGQVQGEVQRLGPAVIAPGNIFGNLVSRTNELLEEHRDWLAKLPRLNEEDGVEAQDGVERPENREINHSLEPSVTFSTSIPSTSHPLGSLITPPPNSANVLLPRITAPPIPGVNCDASVSSAVSSVSASFQNSIMVLNNSIMAIQVSANAAVNVAQASAASFSRAASALAVQLTSASAIQSSAIASASSSASAAIGAAQVSASGAVASANSALASAQQSASAAVGIANQMASDARSSANAAIQSAQSSVAAALSQATMQVAGVRTSASNTLTFALVLTFSIIGSSLLSILAYFLIARYRRRRRDRKMGILSNDFRGSQEQMFRRGLDDPLRGYGAASSNYGSGPASRARSVSRGGEMAVVDDARGMIGGFPMPPAPLLPEGTTIVGVVVEDRQNRGRRERSESLPPQVSPVVSRRKEGVQAKVTNSMGNLGRKNTLTYDPDRPGSPPAFGRGSMVGLGPLDTNAGNASGNGGGSNYNEKEAGPLNQNLTGSAGGGNAMSGERSRAMTFGGTTVEGLKEDIDEMMLSAQGSAVKAERVDPYDRVNSQRAEIVDLSTLREEANRRDREMEEMERTNKGSAGSKYLKGNRFSRIGTAF